LAVVMLILVLGIISLSDRFEQSGKVEM